MATTIAGSLDAKGLRIAVVATRFNSQVVDGLLGGATDALLRSGIADDALTVIRCPGSFEVQMVCRKAVESGGYDAVIALGCIIRGETPHFEYVAGNCARGIAQLNQKQDVPVIFCVLTADTVDQALNRAGLKAGNKGADAAAVAIEMATLLRRL